MRYILLLAVAGVALGSQDAFRNFRKEFPKVYRTSAELQKRLAIFTENYNKMLEHNAKYEAGDVTWWQKVHEDMDLTEEEWMEKRLVAFPPIANSTEFVDTLDETVQEKLRKMGPVPKAFDWVSQGKVSSVKNQAQCGSCAAFSVMGSIESCFAIQAGVMYDDLSEQHILDCAYNHYYNDASGSWGAFGCDGAWPAAYLDWLPGQWNQKESNYPYVSGRTGKVNQCSPSDAGLYTSAYVTGQNNAWYTNELSMEGLLNINPVSTSLMATSNWGGYGGGVMNDNACCSTAYDDNCRYNVNHAILVVGYGSENGQDYWLIKNSWGSSWGQNGYIKLRKGLGHCGVGTMHQTIPTCARA